MDNERFEFRRRAVQPMQCLREGWRLVKSNYWLFLGITFVGSLVAGMGPMGILIGPMMCGIHLCFLRAERGLPIEFSMLFKGFDYFMPSFVATLLMIVPAIVMMIGTYALFFFGMIAGLVNFGPQQRGGGPPGEEFGFFMISLMTIMFVSIMLFSTVIQAIFFFVFPLIVDRELSGWEAVSLSFRAFLANFFGVLALIILIMVLSILSLLACYVGVFFFVPISMAMTMAAYRQVFPEMESPLEKLRDFDDDDDDDHPPAPRWSQSTSTDITSESR